MFPYSAQILCSKMRYSANIHVMLTATVVNYGQNAASRIYPSLLTCTANYLQFSCTEINLHVPQQDVNVYWVLW